MSNSIRRTDNELAWALEHQRRAIDASSAAYDAGQQWESTRLATAVFTIVSDGRASNASSILSQIGLRSQLRFTSSSPSLHMPGRKVLTRFNAPRLCVVQASDLPGEGPTVQFFARCLLEGNSFTDMSFKDWWTEEVFTNSAGAQLSRMNIVSALRSKDGGAHFDADINLGPYLEMKDQQVIGFTIGQEGQLPKPQRSLRNAHLATMRAIAWELSHTLRDFPRLKDG